MSHNLVVTGYRKTFVYNFMRERNLVVLGKRNDDLSSLTVLCVLTEETIAYNCVSPEKEVCLNTCGHCVTHIAQTPETLDGYMVTTVISL